MNNNSIAIWSERNDPNSNVSIEIHVNLWHFSKKKHFDFCDLGVLVDRPRDISCIKFFIPASIERKHIVDCGPFFKSSAIAQGIFNEPLSSTEPANGKSIELKNGSDVFCQIYVFSHDIGDIDKSELLVETRASGTLLTVTEKALQILVNQSKDECMGYFRLRIKPIDRILMPFIKTINPIDRAWNSGFNVIEFIDFRLNEPRTLPMAIERDFSIAPKGTAGTKLVAFLTVVPVASEITSSHKEWHKSRLLEKEIWKEYVPPDFLEDMVVYHWKKEFPKKEDQEMPNFSAFVKMQQRKTNFFIVLIYTIVIFMIGSLGSLISSFLYHWITP